MEALPEQAGLFYLPTPLLFAAGTEQLLSS